MDQLQASCLEMCVWLCVYAAWLCPSSLLVSVSGCAFLLLQPDRYRNVGDQGLVLDCCWTMSSGLVLDCCCWLSCMQRFSYVGKLVSLGCCGVSHISVSRSKEGLPLSPRGEKNKHGESHRASALQVTDPVCVICSVMECNVCVCAMYVRMQCLEAIVPRQPCQVHRLWSD